MLKPKDLPKTEKVELQMTPMIDVVFQLLIFFILTFKITTPEGDFNIKMPLGKSSAQLTKEIPLPPLVVRLEAGSDGRLASITLDNRKLKGFDELHNIVLDRVGDAGPSAAAEEIEVELDCDYNLNYEFVVEAITAVSGKIEGNAILPLIQKIKFANPRKPGG
ncbi:MAG: biopolymer transporter ExbD [Pirellulales bacterium]|nr:biopolymer transporter ExbD [Pirellulales bacterium]